MVWSNWLRSLQQSAISCSYGRRSRRKSSPVHSSRIGCGQVLENRQLLTVSLSLSAATANESDVLAARTITVTATNDVAVVGNETVDVTVTDFEVGDFTLSASQITILAGQTSGFVTLTVLDDTVVEAAETGTISLTNPTAGLVVDLINGSQTLTIANDAADTANVSIVTVAPATGAEGTAQVFNVVLTGDVEAPFAVNLAFSNSGLDAIADAEITGANFDVTFGVVDTAQTATLALTFGAANATTQPVSVRRRQDLRVEGVENYTVGLTVVPPATIPVAQVNSTATAADDSKAASIDNDASDTVTLIVQNRTNANLNPLVETNTDASHLFIVTITGVAGAGVEGGFVVPFQLLDGDVPTGVTPIVGREKTDKLLAVPLDVAEIADASFIATAIDYFFEAGDTSTLTVQVKGDQIVELEELFTVELQAITAQAGGLGTNAIVLPQVVSSDRDLGEISNDDTLITVEVNTDSKAIMSVSDFNSPANGEDSISYSLREAILLSNVAKKDQVIQFTGNKFKPQATPTPRIILDGTKLPPITAAVTITGPHSSQSDLNHPDEMLVISGGGTLDNAKKHGIGTPGTSGIVEIVGGPAFSVDVSFVHFEGGGGVTDGGAIKATGPVSLTLTNTMLSLNQSTTSGGAISASGIASLTISNSTFFYNESVDGGAIDIGGSSATSVNIENSTFYLNNASANGGMLRINNPLASVELNQVTAADNIASVAGAAIQNLGPAAALEISNSIIALNKIASGSRTAAGEVVVAPTEISGPSSQMGVNLISADPLLSGLVDAGGATYVMVPSNFLAGFSYRSNTSKSPAIDAASSSVTTDQRGVTRPAGSAPDLGAVEVTSIQSRFIQVESITVASDIIAVDWETTGAADGIQSNPGDTVALEIFITRNDPAGPESPWSGSGDVVVDSSAVLASQQHIMSNIGGVLRLRVPLATAVDIATVGSASEDPRTSFSLQNLVAGEYRLSMFSLNAENYRSGGSFAVNVSATFTVPGSSFQVLSAALSRIPVQTPSLTETASMLDVELGLSKEVAGWFNWAGLSEKWLQGKNGQSYALLPDGTFIKWDAAEWRSSGHTVLGETMASLSSDYYTNPALLINGIVNSPVTQKGSAAEFLVWLDQSFEFLPSRTTRFDGQRLNNRALYGDGEKWMQAASNEWYYIRPDGGLYRWDGKSGLNGTLITQMPQAVYQHPQLLINATGIMLDYNYGLTLKGNTDYRNFLGQEERWVLGSRLVNTDGSAVPLQQWFIVTADGNVRIWNGTKRFKDSVVVADAGSAVYRGTVQQSEDQLKALYDQDQYFSEWKDLLGI